MITQKVVDISVRAVCKRAAEFTAFKHCTDLTKFAFLVKIMQLFLI